MCVSHLFPIVLALSVLIGTASTGDAQPETIPRPRRLAYPESGVNLRSGWDSRIEAKTAAECITAGEHEDAGQASSADVTFVTDNSSLSEAFEVSASFSIKAIVGGGGGSAKFAQSADVSQANSNFAVHASVANSPRYTVPEGFRSPRPEAAPTSMANLAGVELPRTLNSPGNALLFRWNEINLTPDAAKLAKYDPDHFQTVCGDSFVSATFSGARFLGLISFGETSRRERQELSAAAHASGAGWSAEGAFTQSMNQYQGQSRLTIHTTMEGGSGEPIATTREEMLATVRRLATIAKDAPKVFGIEVTPYRSLRSWPSSNPLDVRTTPRQQIARHFQRLWTLHRSMEDMVRNPTRYFMVFDAKLEEIKKWQDLVFADLQRLRTMARECDDGPRCVYDWNALNQPTDWSYRAHLPVPLAYAGLKSSPDLDEGDLRSEAGGRSIDQWRSFFGDLRHEMWVMEPASERSGRTSEWLPNASRDRLEYNIRKYIGNARHVALRDLFQVRFDNQSRFTVAVRTARGAPNQDCAAQPDSDTFSLVTDQLQYSPAFGKSPSRHCYCVTLSLSSLASCTLQASEDEFVPIRSISDIQVPTGTRIAYASGTLDAGIFSKVAQGRWQEARGASTAFSFDEASTGNTLELVDPSRGVRVRLPLDGGRAYLRTGTGGWQPWHTVQVIQ
jgi:hypothetical protein